MLMNDSESLKVNRLIKYKDPGRGGGTEKKRKGRGFGNINRNISGDGEQLRGFNS